jgi:hypothetical protein
VPAATHICRFHLRRRAKLPNKFNDIKKGSDSSRFKIAFKTGFKTGFGWKRRAKLAVSTLMFAIER